MTDDVIEQAARVLDEEGWTCEYHEPDSGCEECRELHLETARALADAGLLRQEPTGDGWEIVDFLTEFVETVRDEPQFTAAEHALMGAGEMDRAGLLRQAPPTRDEIARAYFARQAEIAAERIGLAEPVRWEDLDNLDHSALLSAADAVLALWEGRKR